MATEQQIKQLENALILDNAALWSMKYRTLKGKPYTFFSKSNPFAWRPWQVDILNDEHPYVVISKGRQLGLSETAVTQSLHYIFKYDPAKIAYVFPKAAQVNDFSRSRVAPVLAEPYFQQFITGADAISIKKIKNSYIFFRASFGEKGASNAEGVDTDFLYLDEFDRHTSEAILIAWQQGLSASKYGYTRVFSTPTLTGRGVDLLYSQSDQRRYFYKCEHCNERQYLTFEDNILQVKSNGVHSDINTIDDGTFEIVCKRCKKPLNRYQIGTWEALIPQAKDIRGYHLSQLDAVWISADDIMRKQYQYQSKQLFLNYVLGETYQNEGLTVTEIDFRMSERCKGWEIQRTEEYDAIVAGIDWGLSSYLVILGIKANGTVNLIEMIRCDEDGEDPLKPANYFAMILMQYRPNCIIADAGYGAAYNTYLYKQFPDRFYSCHWTTSKDSLAKIRFKDSYNETAHEVLVDM